ncbi:hypothetical protein [Bradyrhizobium iriomotense]|uniref:Uncharacterized protein n=1 Tax=Bradyrhizobium iriomotense TaxID=441950 RepID=A0ABQ6B6J6_9BRAD|nr:hypothetical protein [Bradyrhizobium iriomotense]GLR88540.1 hypothetical protein GCM10007857_52520 [Bradyrhizobium iriomotense]
MIAAAIFLFLVGAVLAWAFRVWILVPFCLLTMIATVAIELTLGTSIAAAFGSGLLVGLAPQLGYAFGLLAQGTLLARFAQPGSARKASVALLYKKASVDQRR